MLAANIRMQNNNFEIRIVDYSCRPQLLNNISVLGRGGGGNLMKRICFKFKTASCLTIMLIDPCFTLTIVEIA